MFRRIATFMFVGVLFALGFMSQANAHHSPRYLPPAHESYEFFARLHSWGPVHACETGGKFHWFEDGYFDGGLQFLPSTWRLAGGTRYAPTANLATPIQQMTIAEEWLRRTDASQWGLCARYVPQ